MCVPPRKWFGQLELLQPNRFSYIAMAAWSEAVSRSLAPTICNNPRYSTQDANLMREIIRHYVIILAVAGTVLLGNLGAAKLWDRDEPRNAGCAAEMLQRGDWVVPTFNGQLRSHKPVLLYWLVMASYSVLGISEFSARLPSALLALGTVLLTYHLGARLFCRQVGLWAAVVLVTTLMFDVAGRAATPDATLIFFATLALWIYVAGVFPLAEAASAGGQTQQPSAGSAAFFPRHWLPVALMYASMGMAVLAKGPVGVVLPCAVIGMFLLIVRLPDRPGARAGSAAGGQPTGAVEGGGTSVENTGPLPQVGYIVLQLLRPFAPGHLLRTFWSMRPITLLLVVLAVAAPWYVMVGLRTEGQFLREFFLTHNVARALTAMENHRGPALLYYPAALLVGTFPWSLFALPVLLEASKRLRLPGRWRLGILLCFCWVGVYLAVFSLAQTKLPSYITPTYPAVALLVGMFVHHWREEKLLVSARWLTVAMACGVLVGAGLAVALPLVAVRYVPGEQWAASLGAVVLGGAIACWLLVRRRRDRAASTIFAVTAWVLCLGVFVVLAPRVSRHRAMVRLLEETVRQSPDVQIATLGVHEPSWVFYSGRTVPEFSPTEQRKVARFVGRHDNVCLITSQSLYGRLRDRLPSRLEPVAVVPYFMREENLLLLAPSNSPVFLARRGGSAAK